MTNNDNRITVFSSKTDVVDDLVNNGATFFYNS